MKRIIIIWVLCLMTAGLVAQESADAAMSKARVQLAAVKADTAFYYGIGSVSIGDEGIAKAMDRARENARSNLAEKIQSEVVVEFKRVITGEKRGGDVYSEEISEKIQKRSTVYTDVVLTNLTEEIIHDYPHTGEVTVVLQKSKQQYRDSVTRQLMQNKQMITETIQNAEANFTAGKHLAAVHDWAMARAFQNDSFGDLPLQAVVDPSGKKKNVTAYLNKRMSDFFDGLTISCVNGENLVYDTQGNLNTKPLLYVQYTDQDQKQQPVAKMPLKADFVVGGAVMPTSLMTGDYGQVELVINSINAAHPVTTLNVEIDTERIDMLQQFKLPITTTLALNLNKKRTVAFSVHFKNGDTVTVPRSLNQQLKSAILMQGYAATEVAVPSTELQLIDIQRVNNTYADMFLHVYLQVIDPQKVGGYNNMFVAQCQCDVTLFRMPQGMITATKPLEIQKGFGASEVNAGMNAYKKMERLAKDAAIELLKTK